METVLLGMQAWQVFVAIGVSLCVAEIFIPGFVALPIGLGFLLAAPVAFFSDSLALQLLMLALAELGVFFLLRKFRPQLAEHKLYSNAEGMVGQECEVTQAVSAETAGYVKLYGDLWQAKTHSSKMFYVGERAIITRIEGNKVYIEPINLEGAKA